MGEWIFVGDEMPPDDVYVLGKSGEDSPVSITRFTDGEWDTGGNWKRPCFKQKERYMTSASIVYWMPLPE